MELALAAEHQHVRHHACADRYGEHPDRPQWDGPVQFAHDHEDQGQDPGQPESERRLTHRPTLAPAPAARLRSRYSREGAPDPPVELRNCTGSYPFETHPSVGHVSLTSAPREDFGGATEVDVGATKRRSALPVAVRIHPIVLDMGQAQPTSATTSERKVGWWACQHEHAFTYGDEDWHFEQAQRVEDGYPIPRYCTEVWADGPYARRYDMIGDPCMDSSVLMGPYDDPSRAVAAVQDYKRRGMWPQVGTDTFDPAAD